MGKYNNRTADDVLRAMLDKVRDDVDKRQGSVAYDMLAPAAHEIEMLGWELEAVYLQGFLDTATVEALDYHVHELGLERKPALASIGVANIEGTDGTVIPEGYRFISVGGLSFTADESVTIVNGTANIPVTAVVAGESGNIGLGELVDHERNITGISSVTNSDIFIGGIDAETDDSLRERALFKARKPITSGNANHYRLWATEVEGVVEAKVFPTWDGPNTVKVVVIAKDGGAPDQTVLDAVTTYIETERPIGAKVTILPIEEVPLTINAKLTLDGDMSVQDVQEAVEQSIASYLLSAADGAIIRYTRMGEAILDVRGVLDYADLTINGATNNVSLTEEQVAIVGEVTLV